MNLANMEEQATGCVGAGGYRNHFKGLGYKHVEVFDWTSSAGNWSFLVSRDGVTWLAAFQENNYPRHGFRYSVNEEMEYFGTFEEVCTQLCEEFQHE